MRKISFSPNTSSTSNTSNTSNNNGILSNLSPKSEGLAQRISENKRRLVQDPSPFAAPGTLITQGAFDQRKARMKKEEDSKE